MYVDSNLGVEQVLRFGDFVREIPAKKLVLAGISLSKPEYPLNAYSNSIYSNIKKLSNSISNSWYY